MKKNINNKIFFSTMIALSTITLLCGLVYASDVVIEAQKQTIDGKTNVTKFSGGVTVKSDDITVKSPSAEVKFNKDGKAETALFLERAHAIKGTSSTRNEVKANILKLSLITKRIHADGNVKSVVIDNYKPMVTIDADHQKFDMKKNMMQADGNVVIHYNEMVAKSNTAKLKMNKGGDLQKVILTGNAQIVQNGSEVNATRVTYDPKSNQVIAVGKTHTRSILEDGTPVGIWADYQHMDRISNTLMTSGNVKLTYQDYVAKGPKASFLPNKETGKPNFILLTGRSSIKQDNKIIEADKIEITLDPKNFNAEGNVKTSFSNFNGLNTGSK